MTLWLPEGFGGMCRMHTGRAEAAGLQRRPLQETLADVLDDERARGLGRARQAGLTRAEELDLIALA